MTKEERIARLELEIDKWLEFKPKEGENTFINAHAVHSLLLCIQIIRDGKLMWHGEIGTPPEPWQK